MNSTQSPVQLSADRILKRPEYTQSARVLVLGLVNSIKMIYEYYT